MRTANLPLESLNPWANKPTGSWLWCWFQINPWSDEKTVKNIWKTAGLLTQLVERCTGIAEVMGSNPVQAWIFFRPYFHYCSSSVHYCEDHFHSRLYPHFKYMTSIYSKPFVVIVIVVIFVPRYLYYVESRLHIFASNCTSTRQMLSICIHYPMLNVQYLSTGANFWKEPKNKV